MPSTCDEDIKRRQRVPAKKSRFECRRNTHGEPMPFGPCMIDSFQKVAMVDSLLVGKSVVAHAMQLQLYRGALLNQCLACNSKSIGRAANGRCRWRTRRRWARCRPIRGTRSGAGRSGLCLVPVICSHIVEYTRLGLTTPPDTLPTHARAALALRHLIEVHYAQ